MRYALIACSLALAAPAAAECDALDERVAVAAREALRTGDFTRIAVWVDGEHEQSLRAEFKRAQMMRTRAAFVAAAQRLRHETSPTPCAPFTDAALASREPDVMIDMVIDAIVARVRTGLQMRLRDIDDHDVRPGDVDAGRASATRIADFIRYATTIYAAAEVPPVQLETPIRYEE